MKQFIKNLAMWVAAIFGVSACDIIHPKVMYGEPYGSYDYDLLITDENDVPIPGIQAKPLDEETPETSDSDGMITIHRNYPSSVVLIDVDGPANGGEFEDKILDDKELDVRQTKKGKDWFLGEFEVTGTVKMKKKDAQ